MDTPPQGPHPDDRLHDQVREAARILTEGGVVAIPTDTVYALAASPFSSTAVRRIFCMKGRPKSMALPLLLADATDIARWADEVPEAAIRLAKEFWPGPLTLVLRKSRVIPDAVTAGGETVALRVPNHGVPRELARELGGPITGTSANRSGEPPLTSARAVAEELGREVDMVVDGGPSQRPVPSTVLDLSEGMPRILREGALSADQVQAVVGDLAETPAV